MTVSREDTDPAADVGAPDVLAHVRRALRASAAELAKALDDVPSSDRRRQRALDRWFAGFAAQLRLHHELVDTMVIPALAARGALDQRSLDTIAADHAWIDQILSDLGDALGVLAFGLGAPDWWIGKASDLAAAMSHVLSGQLAREQRLLTPLVDRWFTPREREVVRHEAMRHVASGPARFSLAWLYAHVDDSTRMQLGAYAPTASRLTWRSQRGVYERTARDCPGRLSGAKPPRPAE